MEQVAVPVLPESAAAVVDVVVVELKLAQVLVARRKKVVVFEGT